jgi:peroxiredoxin 2/4
MVVETAAKTTNLPRIGEPAPLFEAMTTRGTIKLDDFRDKWLVLFSHPSDFMPVGTTEFMAFAGLHQEFIARGVELLGLSTDSLPSHIAWIRNIEEKTGVKIGFPIIADSDRYVSMLYGMIHPGENKIATVRCVFIIDPKQIIRAILYYPVTVGRNTDEILRIIDALQVTDKSGMFTPANWKPGEMAIVPAPDTQMAAEDQAKDGLECVDWYLCKKKIE